jgi:hypothetical protein
MNSNESYLKKVIIKAERIDYRKVSKQVKELFDALSQYPKQISREKYTQISDGAFKFLTSRAFNNLPENEKETILFYLLTSPSPREQDRILNSLSFLFKNHEGLEIKDLEALEIERNKLRLYLMLQEALEGARIENRWDDLLSFYQNPDNQKIRPDILQEALEGARRNRRWTVLLSFYQNPDNQKIRPDILQEALEEARRKNRWDALLLFYQNPDNQKHYPGILQEALVGARIENWWDDLLSFYQTQTIKK